MISSPADVFSGVMLVVSPHMDDEVLACGGSIAGLPDKNNVYVVYATNGQLSPVFTGKPPNPELEAIRIQEAYEALSVLGIPAGNLRFLGLPDGHLKGHREQLTLSLSGVVRSIHPQTILVPFRYDRHLDHLALNHATVQAVTQEGVQAEMFEYFVYNRYRLLPGGDIRTFILPDLRIVIDTRPWSDQKREALLRYRSQTTRFFNWQTRSIIPQERVEAICLQPEIFLKSSARYPGASVFGKYRHWIRLAHAVEPRLKNIKEQLRVVLRPEG